MRKKHSNLMIPQSLSVFFFGGGLVRELLSSPQLSRRQMLNLEADFGYEFKGDICFSQGILHFAFCILVVVVVVVDYCHCLVLVCFKECVVRVEKVICAPHRLGSLFCWLCWAGILEHVGMLPALKQILHMPLNKVQ